MSHLKADACQQSGQSGTVLQLARETTINIHLRSQCKPTLRTSQLSVPGPELRHSAMPISRPASASSLCLRTSFRSLLGHPLRLLPCISCLVGPLLLLLPHCIFVLLSLIRLMLCLRLQVEFVHPANFSTCGLELLTISCLYWVG